MMGRTHLAIGILAAGVGGLFMNDSRSAGTPHGFAYGFSSSRS